MKQLIKRLLGNGADNTTPTDNKDSNKIANVWGNLGVMFSEAKTPTSQDKEFLQPAKVDNQPANADQKNNGQSFDELITLGYIYLYNQANTDSEKDRLYMKLRSRENYTTVASYDIRARHARQYKQRKAKYQKKEV